jgi:predicted dehydrogenase
VEQATTAGKHVLCQKPLAEEYSKAVRSVELAERAKVKIAVNQQMRWDAGIRCVRLLNPLMCSPAGVELRAKPRRPRRKR